MRTITAFPESKVKRFLKTLLNINLCSFHNLYCTWRKEEQNSLTENNLLCDKILTLIGKTFFLHNIEILYYSQIKRHIKGKRRDDLIAQNT